MPELIPPPVTLLVLFDARDVALGSPDLPPSHPDGCRRDIVGATAATLHLARGTPIAGRHWHELLREEVRAATARDESLAAWQREAVRAWVPPRKPRVSSKGSRR